MSDAPPLLEATRVTKRFAGIRALHDVSLTVGQGELVGLIGPNGAGKTTLFNCLFGVIKPDHGKILFDGRDLSHVPTYRRARLGIGRTFQRIELFAGMTPRDHLLVAARAHARRGGLLRDLLYQSRPTADEQREVDETLALLGLAADADRPIEALSLGRGRLVELGRALMLSPRLLFLDEPSSGLDTDETAAMAEVLDQVNRERGVAVLLVEHDLVMVRRVAQRLYCVNVGAVIAEGACDEVLADPAVRRAYIGAVA
jgi:branched-chain amino acid transport system ATP-binding protein